MNKMKQDSFNVGDKVFAKVKGYPAWPAVIIEDHNPKYNVKFYGTGETAFVKVKDLFYYLKYKKSFIKPLKRKDYNDALDEIEQVIKDCGGTDGNLEDTMKESEPISTVKQENNESMETKRKLSDLTEKTNNHSVSKKAALEVKRKSETPKVVGGIGRTNKKVTSELTPRKTRLRGSLNSDDKEKVNIVKPLVKSEKNDIVFDNNELKIQTKCLKAADIKMITEDYLVAIIAYAQFVTKEESTYKKKPIEIRTKFENEILLAKLPFGKYVGIKYNTSSPQPINNEYDQAVYDSNVAKSVLSLKKLVEDGTCEPDDDNKFIKDLDIEELEIQSMIKSQIVEHRTYIINQLRIESRLIQLDSNIKNCLGLDSAYPLEATQYLQDMLMLDVTSLMLKKHPHVVEMIGKLKKYIGNTTAWNYTEEQCAQFEKEAKQVRDKADEIYHKFLKLYKICDEDQFWKVFSNNIEAFRDQTKDLSEDSIFALASEPNSRQMFLDNIVKLEEMNIIVSNIGKSANNTVLF